MFAKPKKSVSEGDEKKAGWLSKSVTQAKKHQSMGQLISNPKLENRIRGPFDPYTMNVESKNFPNIVPCFVEVSKESRNKYEWDHDLGVLTLDRVLHSAVYYPHDYGFIPQTLCGDGDPLDILVMSTSPLLPGCVVNCRPICYMVMEDEKGMDEKVLAVNAKDAHYMDIKTMKDLHEHTLREIAEFFATYKKLEKDKWAKVGGWRGTEDTLALIKQSHDNYNKQFELELSQAE